MQDIANKPADQPVEKSGDENIAIRVRNLSKTYRVYGSPKDVLLEALTRKPRHSTFDALRNISFDVPRGQILGILGRNGAGKSTLLKLLTGTTAATTGDVEVNGRMSQMLELGTGFHPDRTGTENIYFGGFCLGMSREEIDAKYDKIVAFSEIGEFLDRPFRTYSMGMQARLTFAVAVHVNPDVLIIDEWLAVGDARFAFKCYERIRQFREEGATIVFVTHNYSSVTEFCDRGMVLDKGGLVMIGEPREVVSTYMGILYGVESKAAVPEQKAVEAQPAKSESTFSEIYKKSADQLGWDFSKRLGSADVLVTDAALLNEAGQPVAVVSNGERISLLLRLQVNVAVEGIIAGFLLASGDGRKISSTDTALLKSDVLKRPFEAGESVDVVFDMDAELAGGQYFLGTSLAHPDGTRLDLVTDALMLEVLQTQGTHTDCLVHLHPQVSLPDEQFLSHN